MNAVTFVRSAPRSVAKHARGLQDSGRAAQLEGLALEPLDLLTFLTGRQIRPQAIISLGVTHALSQRLVMNPKISGENHWNHGDAEHTTSYDANGVEQTNFPHTQGNVVWNGVEYAPLVGEGTQAGGVLYRVDGGAWKALDKPTTIDGNGKIVHSRSSPTTAPAGTSTAPVR